MNRSTSPFSSGVHRRDAFLRLPILLNESAVQSRAEDQQVHHAANRIG